MGSDDKKDKKDKKEKKKQLSKDLPEMEEVSEEQEVLIKELLEKVIGSMKDDEVPKWIAALDDADRRIMGYKFLVARKWSVEEAEKMFLSTIEHKKKYKVDELGHFPSAFPIGGYDADVLNEFLGLEPRVPDENDRIFRAIDSSYKATYHKWDKKGHPLFIERTGRTDVKKVVERYKGLAPVGVNYTQPCIDFHIHFNEVGGRLVRYQDQTYGKERGTRILGVTAILDCDSLTYGTLYNPALELLKAIFAADAAHYPEGLHAMYVVNCPGMIMFAYNIVKGWLDPRVQGKITFLKPHQTTEGLLEFIDEEHLPVFLGGKDESCPLNNIDDVDETVDETLAEEIRVPAGKCIVKCFEVLPEEEITWEFQLAAQNCEFSVTFVETDEPAEGDPVETPTHAEPEDGEKPPATPVETPKSTTSAVESSKSIASIFEGKATETIVEKSKCANGSDTYKASKRGQVVLHWDNGYSWLNSKTVTLRALKM